MLNLRKQIVKNFIIIIIFIILSLIVIPKISYATSISPEKYKPQKPISPFVDNDGSIGEINEPIMSTKSHVTTLIFTIITTALIYFIPTIICLIRKHTYKIYIIWLNILYFGLYWFFDGFRRDFLEIDECTY